MTSFKELARERLSNHTIQVQLKLGDLHLNTTNKHRQMMCVSSVIILLVPLVFTMFPLAFAFKVRMFATELSGILSPYMFKMQ